MNVHNLMAAVALQENECPTRNDEKERTDVSYAVISSVQL